MTYLPVALRVRFSSPIAGAVVPGAAGSSSSDRGGAEPPPKRAHPWSFHSAFTWYLCGAEFHGMLFPLPAFQIRGFEGSVGWNDTSRTLLVPIIHLQPTASVALAMEVLGVGGAPWGIIGTEMFGASVTRGVVPGGAALASGSSGAMRLELPRPYLPSFFDSVSPSINWSQVESEAELASSQVTTEEWLLRQTLAFVHRNILHPVQVGLGKEDEKILPISPMASSVLTCFFASCSHSFYLKVA
jgi:hypothetical protein